MTRITSPKQAVIVAFIVVCAAQPAAAAPLSEAVWAGYLQWLHSMEQTVVAQGADTDQRLLFPFDLPSWPDPEGAAPYRHLAISKAVMELEEVWHDRADGPPALVALANARNYVHLSEYDSALVWYEMAADADVGGRLQVDIAREALAAALAAGDSLAASRQVTNTLGARNLEERGAEVVVAYRWLLANRDARSLDHLNNKLAAVDSTLAPRVRYWHARALAWRGRHAESLAQLETLVQKGPLSLGLGEIERGWVLTALPDLLLLVGRADTAAEVYRVLASSSLPRLAGWGRYQTAGLDLAAARYQAAHAGYAAVCENSQGTSWEVRACSLRELAAELERIRAEGEPYGTAAFYGR